MIAVWRADRTPADRPLLRIFVFAAASASESEHRLAHDRDESRRNRRIELSDELGPQLVTGYGSSAWRRNIAIVQASPMEDLGAFPIEPDCAPTPVITNVTGPELASRDFTLPITSVDPIFVELLERLQS